MRALIGWLSAVTVLGVGWSAGAAAAAPDAGGWLAAGPMGSARAEQTATPLAPSDDVLVVGGHDSPRGPGLGSVELYSPLGHTWIPLSPLATPRYGHTATRLADGSVLVVGGYSAEGSALSSAERYDPTTFSWSSAGSMSVARARHTATLLPDGDVLVVGGSGDLASAELYHPATNSWSSTAPLHDGRSDHSATLLRDGRVLVAGGEYDTGHADWPIFARGTPEIYDPAAKSWSDAAGGGAVIGATPVLLHDGRVLFPWGYVAGTGSARIAELYDPATDTWSDAGDLEESRAYHVTALLPSGRVLVAGGETSEDTAEVFDPRNDDWTATPAPALPLIDGTGTTTADGTVLVAGGWSSAFEDRDALAGAEVWSELTTAAAYPLYFGGETVGVASGIAYLPVVNTGASPLFVTGRTISGPAAADFTPVGGCEHGVSPGDACLLGLTFRPVATGARTATLHLSLNDADGGKDVALTGTGLARSQGPAGPKGTKGSRGPKGRPGARGPAGHDARVRCTVRRLGHARRWRIACRITYPKGTRRGTVHASLTRRHAVYARASHRLRGRRTTLLLHPRHRRLRRGRYTLTLTLSHGGRNMVTTTAVRVGRRRTG